MPIKKAVAQAITSIVTNTGQMLRESTIVQSVVSLGLVGAVIYLWVTGRYVPVDLLQLTWLVVGFWFGSKLSLAKAPTA